MKQDGGPPQAGTESEKRKRTRTKAAPKVEQRAVPGADDVRSLKLPLVCFSLTLSQGFSALLEPFYAGKSLTDPIDTAKARMLTTRIRKPSDFILG